MIERNFYVYILASRRNGTLYTGVTNDLVRRVAEHRLGEVPGFTRTYGVKTLVWFEAHSDVEAAILREKRIKGWNRAWKIAMIEAGNIGWRDLAEEWLGPLVTVMPASAVVIPASKSVIPVPTPVIPAQAGTQFGDGAFGVKTGSPHPRG
jgi:putative endonuclease